MGVRGKIFDWVRKSYNLPFIKRGMRVCHDGKMGTITFADSHVKVRLDGQKYPVSCHPTWEMVYYDEAGNVLADFTEKPTRKEA